jgi:hypothetical protein
MSRGFVRQPLAIALVSFDGAQITKALASDVLAVRAECDRGRGIGEAVETSEQGTDGILCHHSA